MVEHPMFDVFLAHNSADKPQIQEIARQLKARGLKPWLDEEQIPPGVLFVEAIQRALPQIKCAAVCIGSTGLGKWQTLELASLIGQFVEKGSPVIPLLLPGVERIPDNLYFLRQFNWVNFERIDDADALYRLEWGITGVNPNLINQPVSPPPIQPKANPSPEKHAVELKSEKGVDYTKLRDLLADGKWEEADQETTRAMLQAAGREKEEWLRVGDIDEFPCEDLRTIDRLWKKYSQGRFGFSVQKEIYQSLGGTREYNEEVWDNFCEQVGWTKEGKLAGAILRLLGRGDDRSLVSIDLDDECKVGHLPVVWFGHLPVVFRVMF